MNPISNQVLILIVMNTMIIILSRTGKAVLMLSQACASVELTMSRVSSESAVATRMFKFKF